MDFRLILQYLDRGRIILFILLLGMTIFSISNFFSTRSVRKMYEAKLEKLQDESDKKIQRFERTIITLERDIQTANQHIEASRKIIQELDEKSQEVKIKYISKIKEVKGFTALDLEYYWKEEFHKKLGR